MATYIALMMVLLGQDPAASQPSPAAAPSYEEDVRCAGVLYGAQLQLKQRDERQPAIQASLEAAIARIDALTTAGKVAAAAVETDMQRAVNEGMAATGDMLTACTTEPVPPVPTLPDA